MRLREFPLNGLPCVECGQPGLAFVPPVGVKHHTGWCRIDGGDWPPVPDLRVPHPRVRWAEKVAAE